MSSSRYPRSGSPTGGRRFVDPARSSNGALYSAYDAPPSSYSRHRDSVTSPRSSGERVIPISTERYVNGERVPTSSSSSSRPSYDAYDSRSRRVEQDLARNPPSSSPAYSRSAVVHQQPEYRPRGHIGGSSSGSSTYDNGSYISSNTSASNTPRREHKKIYSVDDDKNLRLQAEQASRQQHASGPPRTRNKDYHLSGPKQPRPQNLDDYDAYEYTDARGMFRDTEPRWRPRQHSFDGPRRERPSSMVDAYNSDPRRSNRELGPPPSTRGLHKINAAVGGVSRHGSLTGAPRSPPRHHNRRNSADYYSDQDENYKVAPRIAPAERSLAPYEAPPERRDVLSMPRDDRREPRPANRRFEDSDVASRGFGIRAPSADPPRDVRGSREESLDRYSGYSAEPPRKALPAPREPEYPASEPPRPHDREPPRSDSGRPAKRESPPRDWEREKRDHEDLRREREREPPREREAPRERDYDRRDDRRGDDDRRHVDRRPERDHDDDYRERERHAPRERERDDSGSHVGSSAGGAVAGAAAAGAAAYGAKELYDRHHNDAPSRELREPPREPREQPRESREPPRESREPPRESREPPRESREPPRESREPPREPREQPREPREQPREQREPPRQIAPSTQDARGEERARSERGPEDKERGRFVEESPEDMERPRRRHYARESDEIDRSSEGRPKPQEALDPEEDYRRRVQQETERVQAEESYREPTTPRRERPSDIGGGRSRDGHDSGSETGKDMGMALTPYKSPSDDASQGSGEDGESFQEKRRRRVSIVEPPKAIAAPKSILRKPTEKFPEDPNPIREGVAPLKDAKNKDAPPTARWTKINRSMVNPEALEEAQERFEERQDHVIVLRVLTREDIQKLADRTKEIREGRYDKEHRRHRRDKEPEHDREERREHDSDRDRDRDRDRERDRHHSSSSSHHREREREDKNSKPPGLEDMLTGIVTGVLEQTSKQHK